MIKVLFFLSISFLFLTNVTAEVTGTLYNPIFNSQKGDQETAVKEQVLCGFKQNNADKSSKQQERAEYVADEWANVIPRLIPALNGNAVKHLVAQTVAETGSLRDLKEKESKFDSSKMKHKGRGTFQTTFADNYAKLEACAQVIRNNPPPAQLTQEMIKDAKPIKNGPAVQNPDHAMSENTEKGRQLNALSAICYTIDTAARHPRFAASLKDDSKNAIDEVGVAINMGPGALGKGKKPNGAKARQEAFKKAEACPTGV